MPDDAVAELERAITSAGTHLLRLDKYRRGRASDVDALRLALADVGARARRAVRDRPADRTEHLALGREAEGLAGSLQAILESVLAGPEYRHAVDAFTAADDAALRPLLVSIFEGVRAGPAPARLFAPIAWSGRRGPRAPREVVAHLEEIRREGIEASGDPLDPAVDPELPAVALSPTWPDGAPIALGCAATDLGGSYLIGPAGDVLVHRPRVRAPFAVLFQSHRDAVDEWVTDPVAYRDALTPLLAADGWVTGEAPVPTTP